MTAGQAHRLLKQLEAEAWEAARASRRTSPEGEAVESASAKGERPAVREPDERVRPHESGRVARR